MIYFEQHSDAWLEDMLGRPACNVVLTQERGETLEAVTEQLRDKSAFATAKIEVDDVALSLNFQDSGFRQVDTALTFRRTEKAEITAASNVRYALPADRGAVETIAREAFMFSRFHLDPRVPNQIADKIKSEWAGNFFSGRRGDGMIVALDDSGVVAGFCQLLSGRNGDVVIDLIAVAPASTRRGLARAMIAQAAHSGTGSGPAAALVVGTQAANLASVNLYEALGFRLTGAKQVLHFA